MEGFLTQIAIILSLVAATGLAGRGASQLWGAAAAISNDWRLEIAARRCAELQALAYNLTDAAAILTRQFPSEAEPLAISVGVLLNEIEKQKNTASSCSFISNAGLEIRAVPRRQFSTTRIDASQPNWVVTLELVRPTNPRPE